MGFEIQTDNITSIRRSDLELINKKEENLTYYGFSQRTKKVLKHEGNCNWCTWSSPQRLGRGTKVGNQRMNWDNPNYRIGEIG